MHFFSGVFVVFPNASNSKRTNTNSIGFNLEWRNGNLITISPNYQLHIMFFIHRNAFITFFIYFSSRWYLLFDFILFSCSSLGFFHSVLIDIDFHRPELLYFRINNLDNKVFLKSFVKQTSKPSLISSW